MTALTNAEVHALNHTLIAGRIRELMITDARGRRLEVLRELLAYSLIGHARQWPTCPVTLTARSTA